MMPDQVLEVDEGAVLVDHLGRSTGPERAVVGAWDFLRLACEVLGVEVDHVRSSRRDPATAEARQLLATVGIERCGSVLGQWDR